MEITGALVASSSTPFGICEPKEVSRTRQGGLGGGGGGLELVKARPPYHLLLPKSFLLSQNFLDFFLFSFSPNHSILFGPWILPLCLSSQDHMMMMMWLM